MSLKIRVDQRPVADDQEVTAKSDPEIDNLNSDSSLRVWNSVFVASA